MQKVACACYRSLCFQKERGFCSFDEYVFKSVEREARWCCLPDKLQSVTVAVHVARYNALHHKLFGSSYLGIPGPLSPKVVAALSMPFAEFLARNHCQALLPMALYGMCAQGYGNLRTIPAYYGLLWLTPAMLNGYLLADTPLGKFPRKSMFKHGFGALWTEVVHVNGLSENIKLNTSITKVTRTGAGVTITGTAHHDSDVSRDFTAEFDYLVLGAPLKGCGEYMDLDDEERQLFEPLTHFQFLTTLFERPPEPTRSAHVDFYPDVLSGDSAGGGGVFAIRDSFLAVNGGMIGASRDLPREQMCYQFLDRGAQKYACMLFHWHSPLLSRTRSLFPLLYRTCFSLTGTHTNTHSLRLSLPGLPHTNSPSDSESVHLS